jgi:peptidyl-prolyl cis-trans isomerase SurA
MRVDDAEVDRAVQSIARRTSSAWRSCASACRRGHGLAALSRNLRDQIMVERCASARSTSASASPTPRSTAWPSATAAATATRELNIAQILVTVPEGASAAERPSARARRASAGPRARRRGLRHGRPRALGRRQPRQGRRDRPAPGVAAARPLRRRPCAAAGGEVHTQPVRSGAGFHVLKLLERRRAPRWCKVTQTRARHILLRTVAAAPRRCWPQAAGEMRARSSAAAPFEDWRAVLRRRQRPASGGDLGWAAPGNFVPEFEEAMNRLPLGGISPRGVALRRAPDPGARAARRHAGPKQLREQARNMPARAEVRAGLPGVGPRSCARAPTSRLREPPQ